ncbi:unnamed protein product [Zymoseptoria tritici ST99CH_1A5]|uniref:Uncharacterized protein n=1 Tax=Zymoseptoria tritici ST99CH_1A5 TaxID=1276529 RepID=A0A1Y6L2Z6_ZYMTR|nr:unnamed protein product [Zymoseptoria tritici ST99CH_1A5]
MCFSSDDWSVYRGVNRHPKQGLRKLRAFRNYSEEERQAQRQDERMAQEQDFESAYDLPARRPSDNRDQSRYGGSGYYVGSSDYYYMDKTQESRSGQRMEGRLGIRLDDGRDTRDARRTTRNPWPAQVNNPFMTRPAPRSTAPSTHRNTGQHPRVETVATQSSARSRSSRRPRAHQPPLTKQNLADQQSRAAAIEAKEERARQRLAMADK